MKNIIFATGIECSYPKVADGKRRDQLDETKHYKFWRRDLELCQDLGVKVLRYGPPYYRMHTSPHGYDWSFTDEVLPVMRSMGLEPIIDLCHFGVPDWAGDFQNMDWPELFADYATQFARRYPWIRYYTPVNEIYICAKFSGKLGIWNEQLTSDRAMVAAHANQCKATLLCIERILEQRPDAIFFQSEAAEIFVERNPGAASNTSLLNELRFITFDFLYGRPPSATVLVFLLDNGATMEMYHWFMEHGSRIASHCIMGMDYYALNERVVSDDGTEAGHGPILGWHSIARQYFERYHKPMMLTETNAFGQTDDSPTEWMWKTWHNVRHLRNTGAPVIGYTWYSLVDQVDWDVQLRAINGNVVPTGLFTLDRKPRPVADAFRELCQQYGSLPLQEDLPFAEISCSDVHLSLLEVAAAEGGLSP